MTERELDILLREYGGAVRAVCQAILPGHPQDAEEAELAVALESHLESRELMAQIMALPPPDGELFLRRYLYGETAAQLGVRFAMPAATVRTRLHRARLALQKLLKED